jgi:hypothetical protein
MQMASILFSIDKSPYFAHFRRMTRCLTKRRLVRPKQIYLYTAITERDALDARAGDE